MPKQTNKEKALAALLKTSSVADAAKECSLSEETLYRFLRDKGFLKDYREARRAIVEGAVTEIQQATRDAAQTLKRNLSCGNPAAENQAARLILENAVKGVETLDILTRLEEIENAVETQNQKS